MTIALVSSKQRRKKRPTPRLQGGLILLLFVASLQIFRSTNQAALHHPLGSIAEIASFQPPATITIATTSNNSSILTSTREELQEKVITPIPPTPAIVLPNNKQYEIVFLSRNAVRTVTHMFAASWWMTRDRFMESRLQDIHVVEDDVFVPLRTAGNGWADVRFTQDWLDFSVEHLSKWQKAIGYSKEATSLVVGKCWNYVFRRAGQGNIKVRLLDTYMNTTLAVIPMGVGDGTPNEGQQIWVAYLAATMTSLIQHGIKRIVVVGHYDMDAILTSRAFTYFVEMDEETTIHLDPKKLHNFTFLVQSMTEFGYVHTQNVFDSYVRRNIPKGALVGLHAELNVTHGGKHEDGCPRNDTIGSYLGKEHVASDFDYIFLTEADQILQARLAPAFWGQLEQNRALVPHRLQPIPHGDDLEGIPTPPDLVGTPKGHHAPVIVLNNSETTDACCDIPNFLGEKRCGWFWWTCGYYNKTDFSYFDHFDFMRLSPDGSGVVSLAGSAHGRACRVKPNGRGTCGEDGF